MHSLPKLYWLGGSSHAICSYITTNKSKPKQALYLFIRFRKSDNVTHLWHFSLSSPTKEVILTSSWKMSSRQPRKKMSVLPLLPDSCVQRYVPVFNAIMLMAATGTCSATRSVLPASRYMIYSSTLTAHFWKESTNSFPNFWRSKLDLSLLCRAPGEADSWSSSQWDISISGLFFILSIFHSQRRGTLMSLKSHYGCCSELAQADFLWFCSGAEEMRGAKSPLSKIQKDMAGHEGVCLSVTHGPDCFIPSWRRT